MDGRRSVKDESEGALVDAARGGDREAFATLIRPLRRPLKAYVYRMLANPDDAEDAVQETLIKAMDRLPRLRASGAFRSWLFQIATRTCLDQLRRRKRWRVDAQIDGERFSKADEARLESIMATTRAPDFGYDFHEHIAFCFTCLGRSLPPEQQAALLLGDVLGFSGREAAACLEVTDSVYRHRLSAARKHMRASFDDLCALVRKEGVCYQCDVLREAAPADRRGPAVAPLDAPTRDEKYTVRLRIVQQADLEAGGSSELHAQLLRIVDARQAALAG